MLVLALVAGLAIADTHPVQDRSRRIETTAGQEANCRDTTTTANGVVTNARICRRADGTWERIDDDEAAAAAAAAAAADYLSDEEPAALAAGYEGEVYCVSVLQLALLEFSETGDPRAVSVERAFRYFTGALGQRLADGEITRDQLMAELERQEEAKLGDPGPWDRDLDMCEAFGS